MAAPSPTNLSLEREGFIFVRHETRVKDFYDEAEVRSVYYPETEQLVKANFRREASSGIRPHAALRRQRMREAKQISGPVRNAHNDYTEWSGPQRVRDLLPDEAEELLKRRFAVVQTWRPIRHPVQREPLAIADARSIGTKELIPSSRVYPDRVGEVYHCTFNPEHRWYYFPNMQRNEAMVFKSFDSIKDGRARWTAHCAFDDPTSPPDAPPRESIEMRTLAFSDSEADSDKQKGLRFSIAGLFSLGFCEGKFKDLFKILATRRPSDYLLVCFFLGRFRHVMQSIFAAMISLLL